MRVSDAEDDISDALNSMDWYRYLCAMWLICGEFQASYNSRPRSADHVECDDDAMMDAVLAVTRRVVSAGTVSPDAAREADELWRRWQALTRRSNPDIMDLAQLRLWDIFADLIGEIAGSRRHYGARAKMNETTRDLWAEEATGPQPGAEWVNNPNEEIADASARARGLTRVQRIVGVVATAGELDPVAINALADLQAALKWRSMMTRAADCVRQLISLAGAPAVPGAAYGWPAIEGSIGLRLPEDYKLLAELLPPGWFRRFARLLYPGPSGPFLPPDVSGQLDVMREWRAGGYARFPYPIFPEPGGLLPWGEAVGGAMLFWLTGPGDPDNWPVIAATAQWEHWERFDGTVCEFLTEVAAGHYDASHFSEGPILQTIDAGESHTTGQPIELAGRGPVFTPDPPRPAPAPPSGTRPDFWLRHVLGLGSDRAPVNEFPALAELAGAPPAEVAPVDWAAVHARLGVTLPSDYRAFADAYGAGTFGDVRIAVPGVGGNLDLFALLERKAAQIRGMPRHAWQAPLYPEPGGTICWGETADGHAFGWAPASTDPDQWGVVVIRPTRDLSGFKFNPGITFSTALKEYKLYAEQHPGLALGLLPRRDPEAGPITFTPGQPA